MRLVYVEEFPTVIETITREGDWLVTTSERRPGHQILSLPGLQLVTLAGD